MDHLAVRFATLHCTRRLINASVCCKDGYYILDFKHIDSYRNCAGLFVSYPRIFPTDSQAEGGGRTGLMVRASDFGSGDPGSILGRVGVFVSLSKRHLLPKSTGNTQE